MAWSRASLKDDLARCDRILTGALSVLLATASACVSWNAASKSSHHMPAIPVVQRIVEYVQSQAQPVEISVEASPGDAMRAQLLAEHRCLSEVMYYEARGEGVRGEMAVAEVVFRRLESRMHGPSICAVVYEGANRPVCQFSFVCDGSLDRPRESVAWRVAQGLATRILTGALPLSDATEGALNYHAVYVRPVWADNLVRTAQIGNHIFYRPRGGVLAADPRSIRGSLW